MSIKQLFIWLALVVSILVAVVISLIHAQGCQCHAGAGAPVALMPGGTGR
jgi:hypothetical protein